MFSPYYDDYDDDDDDDVNNDDNSDNNDNNDNNNNNGGDDDDVDNVNNDDNNDNNDNNNGGDDDDDVDIADDTKVSFLSFFNSPPENVWKVRTVASLSDARHLVLVRQWGCAAFALRICLAAKWFAIVVTLPFL